MEVGDQGEAQGQLGEEIKSDPRAQGTYGIQRVEGRAVWR